MHVFVLRSVKKSLLTMNRSQFIEQEAFKGHHLIQCIENVSGGTPTASFMQHLS
jgi:hypothetical protein